MRDFRADGPVSDDSEAAGSGRTGRQFLIPGVGRDDLRPEE